jgi:transposase-like protein
MIKKDTKLSNLKIKGKPVCPYCGNPLNYVFDDVIGGHTSEKCKKCNKVSIVDLASLVVEPA